MSEKNFVAEPGTHSIVITRLFDAPRELVFKAFTDPDLVAKWWGGQYETVIKEMDARPGGTWRFIHPASQGEEDGFHGVFHDVVSPERLVYTFEYEGMPGHVLLETIVLDDEGGKTKMTDTSVFQSVADRDGMLQSGMEAGATEGLDQLEKLLATMTEGATRR